MSKRPANVRDTENLLEDKRLVPDFASSSLSLGSGCGSVLAPIPAAGDDALRRESVGLVADGGGKRLSATDSRLRASTA